MSLDKVRVIDLPRIVDRRGNLTFVEGSRHVPFDIKRAYYLYDVPGGATRGGHAHVQLQEFIVAVSGSFTVVLKDGMTQAKFLLNRPYFGLLVPAMVWRELEDFSSGSVCLVLASDIYDESDYIRDFDSFAKDSGGDG